MFAGLASAEAISYIIGISMINPLYSATLHILPGFAFIAIASVYFLGLLLVGYNLTYNINNNALDCL